MIPVVLYKETCVRNRAVLIVLVSSLLLGLSPLSADSVIQRGTDVFITAGDGKTFYDFSHNPIPAGFFCERSKVFTDRVEFKGLPLATKAPGNLWGADTVIERLDNAIFDDKGVGVTRLQFRALSLVSTAPVKTPCGAFHVYVSLAGKQRVTRMRIRRTEEGGGNFTAPLAVDVRMTFIPVKPARAQNTRKLEIKAGITFPAQPLPWRFRSGVQANKIGAVVVDTDGNLAPDTLVPGTSNFAAGQSPGPQGGGPNCCSVLTCHYGGTGEEHCYYPIPEGCDHVMLCDM
jgi:hypothetical protein